MTCSTLTAPEDLKVLIREGIAKLCPPSPSFVPAAFEAFHTFLAPRELGPVGYYLLMGLRVTSETHMRLRDVLLCQPDFAHEFLVNNLPLFEPSLAAPSAPNVLDNPRG